MSLCDRAYMYVSGRANDERRRGSINEYGMKLFFVVNGKVVCRKEKVKVV